MNYDNTDRGVLFKNSEKDLAGHPDYRGSINVGGTEYWLSAWLKTSKKDGRKYLSLSCKLKAPARLVAATTDDLNDDVPF
jgi:uncharacterized protein (DUF736 family)